jgi:hypothetical protein
MNDISIRTTEAECSCDQKKEEMFMRKHLPFVFASLFLVAGSLQAQTVTMRVDIPFDFVVGKAIMHAGTYTIKPMNTEKSVLELQSFDFKNSVFLGPGILTSDRAPHENELVFQVSDGQYFLWQIWTQDSEEGRELSIKRPTTQEANAAPPHTVVVAAVVASRD